MGWKVRAKVSRMVDEDGETAENAASLKHLPLTEATDTASKCEK